MYSKVTGKGFLIWKLADLLPVKRIIDALNRADCSWVCIKVANGILEYNNKGDIDGDKELKAIIQELKDAGFQVGGWTFIFTQNIAKLGLQAAKLGERVQKLGLEFVMVDAEEVASVGAYWKSGSTRYTDAKTFTDVMRPAGVPLTMPAYLCTYRYPYLHHEFPFSKFLKSDSINGVAQQLYWIGSHNPRDQLIKSIAQYDDWINQYDDMVPIGAAFGEHGWVVTPEEITEFVDAVYEFGMKGCGFWVLDQAINHPEWLDAIAEGGEDSDPDPDPDPDPPGEVPMEEWAVYIDEWARTEGYDGPAPIVNNYYWVQVDTDGARLNVRKDKTGAVIDTLDDGQQVKVFPPEYYVDGYTRGEIDEAGSNRWIALEFTIKL